MFVVDFVVEPTTKAYDPMLTEVLQDSDSDLGFESLTSSPIEQASDMDNDFEQNVERWENEDLDFNIFDYIGEDEEEQDQGTSLAQDPKDNLYKQWAYNQTTFGGTADYSAFQTSYNNPTSSTANLQQPGTAFDAHAYEYGSTSSSSMAGTAAQSQMNGIASYLPGKQEPTYIYDTEDMAYLDEEYPAKAPSASIPNDPFILAEKVNAATKKPPRKYRLKSDNEKVNPVYKTKRAKNNDAVRRSREKAKISQQQKEQRLEMLEADIRALYDYHLKTVEYIKQNCGCGVGIPKLPKLQSLNM